VAQFASVLDVPLDAVELELRAVYPHDGLADIVGNAMERLTYVLDIKSPASAEQILKLMEVAEKECHATNTLRLPVEVVPHVRLNREELDFTLPSPR
jgi:predicted translin family RNA/ssDNA-binding protein